MSRRRTAATGRQSQRGQECAVQRAHRCAAEDRQLFRASPSNAGGRLILPSGEPVELLDLPGSYGLLPPPAADEEVTRKAILGELEHEVAPDVLVAGARCIQPRAAPGSSRSSDRAGKPCLSRSIARSGERDGLTIDPRALESELGVPVVRPWRCGAAGSTRSPPQSSRPRSAPPNRATPPAWRRAPADRPRYRPERDSFGNPPPTACTRARPAVPPSLAGAADPVRAAVRRLPGGVRRGGALRRCARFGCRLAWLSGARPTAAGLPRDLLTDGILAGVGSVVGVPASDRHSVFLILAMEASGSWPAPPSDGPPEWHRSAFRAQLHPALSSFACAIPGIMATAASADAKGPLTTILIAR